MLQGGGLHTAPWLLPTLSRLIIRRGHRGAWGQAPPATLPPSKGLLVAMASDLRVGEQAPEGGQCKGTQGNHRDGSLGTWHLQ